MKQLIVLTLKNMKVNKKNNILILIAITLSSMLLFSVALAFSTYRVNKIENTIDYYGNHYAIFTNVYMDQKHILDEDALVDKYFYIYKIDQMYKDNTNVIAENNIYLYGISDDFQLDLDITGRLPEDESELLISFNLSSEKKYKLNEVYEIDGKDYKIVGIYNNTYKLTLAGLSSYYTPIFTKSDQFSDSVVVWVYLNTLEDVYNNLGNLQFRLNTEQNILNFKDVELKINDEYLSLLTTARGEKAFNQAIIQLMLMLVMTILSFITLFVIYNSFAISVNERKKKYATYKSIGASSKQIIISVLFEAFILTLIAIPLGYLLSVFLVQIVLLIVNNLLFEVIEHPFVFSVYVNYIIFAIFYIIASVFLASFSPAKRAGEASIMDVIRQNTEINKKEGLFKKRRLIKKIFGIEGIISAKSSTRNYRKYNVTVFSIVIGCILYLVFSIFINLYFYLYSFSSEIDNQPAHISFESNLSLNSEIIEDFTTLKNINNYSYSHLKLSYFEYDSEDLSREFLVRKNNIGAILYIDNDNYNKLKKEFNINNDNPMILGNSISINFSDTTFKESIHISPFFIKEKISVDSYEIVYATTMSKGESIGEFNNLNIIYDYGSNLKAISSEYKTVFIPTIILPIDEYKTSIEKDGSAINIQITSKDYYKLDKEIKEVLKKYSGNIEIGYDNYFMINYGSFQTMKAIGIIIYLTIFILFSTTIISIFSTINTNLSLRRREFAVLRSMGLNKKGFNKMVLYESIMLSIKGLLFGILLSIALLMLFINIFQIQDSFISILFFTLPPYVYIQPLITCIVVVFLVTYMSFYIATNKFKNDNIADVLKEDSF